jgi:drug/metabolite transporter (DMT)-like permease
MPCVVYAAIVGAILFGEVPDVWSFIGYVIIIGTAFAKWYLLTRRGE